MALTTTERDDVNKMCPVAQRVDLGTEVYGAGTNTTSITEINTYALFAITNDITADASGGVTTAIPFDCVVIDVIVQATATSGSGTVLVSSGANAITDAMVMAVDTTIVRAGTIDTTYSSVSSGDDLTFTTNGAADRGLVKVIVMKT